MDATRTAADESAVTGAGGAIVWTTAASPVRSLQEYRQIRVRNVCYDARSRLNNCFEQTYGSILVVSVGGTESRTAALQRQSVLFVPQRQHRIGPGRPHRTA